MFTVEPDEQPVVKYLREIHLKTGQLVRVGRGDIKTVPSDAVISSVSAYYQRVGLCAGILKAGRFKHVDLLLTFGGRL